MKLISASFRSALLAVLLFGCSGESPAPSTPTAPAPPAHKATVVIYNLLSHPILDGSIAGIKAGLTAEGFAPDQLEVREVSANGEMDKLNAIAREVVAGSPDVIIPVSTPVTQAVVAEASPTQAIVYSTVTNPNDVGMDKHPVNMTGVSDAVNYGANLDLIHELFPKARHIGIIYNPGEANSQYGVDQVKQLAPARGFDVQLATVSSSNEVAPAASLLVEKVDVIYIGSDNTVVGAIEGVLKVAEGRRVPVVASDSGSVEKGALAAVSVDYEKLGRAVAPIVGHVLRDGVKPGTIPPVTFLGDSLLLNRSAATKIQYEFPPAVLSRAARVIE